MHNLHIITVVDTGPGEACSQVENCISDWGDDNNWRIIIGCISEDDEVYDKEASSHFSMPLSIGSKGTLTVEKVEKVVADWMEYPDEGKALALMTQFLHGGELESSTDWYELHKYVEFMYQLYNAETGMPDGKVDLFEINFFPYQYDECGVTCLIHAEPDRDAGEKMYAVFVDMHS